MNELTDFKSKTLSDQTCEIHGCQKWFSKLVIKGELEEIEICPECEKQSILTFEKQLMVEADNNNRLAKYHNVFMAYSICSDKLKEKSLDNYEIKLGIDEQAVNFVKRMEEFYRTDGIGNTIITGPSGAGKSHLSYAMAKLMNERFQQFKISKSVLYVSVVKLFNLIEESFQVDNGFSKAKMIDLLSRVDYLFLDDLGKESRKENSQQKNEWRQSILFEILDNRQNTIINTNLDSAEIKRLYADGFGNGAISDRIFEGVKGHVFQYPKDFQSRRY